MVDWASQKYSYGDALRKKIMDSAVKSASQHEKACGQGKNKPSQERLIPVSKDVRPPYDGLYNCRK